MNTRSIRFRLTLWHAGLMTAVFILLGAATLLALRHYLAINLRETELRRARQIADSLLMNVKQTGEAFVASEIKTLYAPEVNDRFIRITRKDGSTLYASGQPKDQSFDPSEIPGPSLTSTGEFCRNVKLPGKQRLIVAGLDCRAANGGDYIVEVGGPTSRIDAMANQVLVLLILGLPVVLLVAVGGGYFLVQRALAPVEQTARKAEEITLHNLSERLPVANTGDELQRLAISLNHMIGRLEEAIDNSKRFVADASHELRTPLTILRGELEQLTGNGSLDNDNREIFGSMLEEVERLARIVEGLLALSRLDSGEAQTEWVSFDLGELATTTADQMSLLAEDRGIKVVCEVGLGIFVAGDRARLTQVVVNLLDNAIKYTSSEGAILLKVSRHNDFALLEVADNGMGIPAGAVPHVFDRFFRVDKARSRDQGGAGLGLSIVKSICIAHGAEVQVESFPGKGSRFQVRLPLASAELTAQEIKNEDGIKNQTVLASASK